MSGQTADGQAAGGRLAGKATTGEGTAGEGTAPALEDYRREVRAWLAANLDRRDDDAPARLRGGDAANLSPERVAQQRDLQRRVYEGGYAGITWPAQFGGQGLTPAHEEIFAQESRGYVVADLGIAGLTTTRVCGPTILAHGTDEFRRTHIPRMLSGEEIWVQLFSEPGAGSDLAGVSTRATRTDTGDWVLNGSKVWTSGAYYADYGLCLARTDPTVPKHRGLTWFGVPLTSDGVTIRPIREINGSSEFCEEFFDDVVVSDANRIGAVGDGWTVARTMMVFERLGGDPDETPRHSGARELAPDLVALARRVGRQGDPVTRQLIARAHVIDLVKEQLDAYVAALTESGAANPNLGSYSKLAAGTLNPVRASIGLEIAAAAGVVWHPQDTEASTTALNYLNGRILAIAGGTNEMQRNGISERVLGLPREPAHDLDRPFNELRHN
ncbi:MULTISPECIES: acyl-CoA dehydrogenase family protein [unclassified Frankia]|uniref:acyl-CoA dehydrogenase family protein n=1 Tax=unclassified Frankia TaxID=2632575 RepID=UPI0007075CE7|nr:MULTISPECIES: acyl-CoA dehydrogenase family protein [unclassified Frankia]KQM05336.1 acyl-CoA dehydrogenase [Frankia sp. CpI1-P]